MGPMVVASRTPVQAFAGSGARQRKSPTGGCANGMFLKTATPSALRLPRSWPVLIETVGSDPAAKPCPKHRTPASRPDTLMDFIGLPLSLTARVVRAVFRIARAVVLRMRGIRTQGTAAPRKCPPRSHNRFRSLTLLHPIHRRAQHVEAIERSASSAAVAHARRKKQAAPIRDFRRATVGGCHALVV